MSNIKQYNSIEDVLSYFINFLPDPKSGGVATVSKYAVVDNENVTVRAVKQRVCDGFAWNFEIILA